MAFLHAVAVVALVASAIRPALDSVAVLLVAFPVALVRRAVGVVIMPTAVGFIVLPLAFVRVSVRVEELAEAVGLVVKPSAFIARPVDPDLDSFTVTAFTDPLSSVLRTAFECLFWSFLSVFLLRLACVFVEASEVAFRVFKFTVRLVKCIFVAIWYS